MAAWSLAELESPAPSGTPPAIAISKPLVSSESSASCNAQTTPLT
jgi:hypothetical protein